MEEIVQSIEDNNVNQMKECFRKIADVNASIFNIIQTISDQQKKDEIYKSIPLNQLTLLHIAAYYDSLECFIYLHLHMKLNIRGRSANGLIPLHYACWEGSIEVVSYILSIDPEQAKIKFEDENDFNLLYCSIFGGRPEILEELILKGFNLEMDIGKKNMILQKAIEFRNKDCLILLFNSLYKNQKSLQDTLFPIEKAIVSLNLEAFEILYDNFIDASTFRHVISLLCKFDIEKKFKKIIIQILNSIGRIDIEPVYNEDILNEGICHWACKYHDLEITKLLFDKSFVYINRFDKYYRVGPAYLVDNRDSETVQILRFLIGNGFDVNAKHEKGVYLLESFLFAIDIDYDAIKCLVDNKAKLDFPLSKPKTHKNYTLIEYVNERGDEKLKRIFNSLK